jgi:acyl carrier protein
MGFYVLTKEDIRMSFLKLMMGNFEQMICGKFDWIKLGECQVVSSQPRKFSNIMEKYAGNLKSAKHSEHTFSFDEYVDLDKESQHRIIYDIAKSSLSDAIVIDNNTLQEDTQFSSLGIDSMSAMSLVNMIFDITQVRVPLENVLTGSSTLKSLTCLIEQKLNLNQPKLASRNKQKDNNILQLTCEEMLRNEVTFLQKSTSKWRK